MKKYLLFSCLSLLGILLLFTACSPAEDNYPSVSGNTNPLSIETASLLTYFPFESTAYTTIRSIGLDSSKVSVGDSVRFLAGKRGYCFQGKSVKSFIQYNLFAGGSFQKMSEFTIAAWVKLPEVKNNAIAPLIMINGGDTLTGSGSLSLTIDSLSLKGYVFSDSARVNKHELSVDRSLLKAGEWVHLAFSYTSSTSTMALYINGSRQKEDTCFARTDTVPKIKTGALKLNMVKTKMQMTKMYIGAWPQQVLGTPTSTMQFFTGNLDEMHIWKKGLTDEDIKKLYNAEVALSKK